MEKKFTVGLIVANRFGVLNRISGLYSKRSYNIDSLAVGETEDPSLSRMTIVSSGDEQMREQVIRQLHKLPDVKLAFLLDEKKSIAGEHIIIKLSVTKKSKVKVSAFINDYSGKTLDFGDDYVSAEITCEPSKMEQFIKKAKTFGILEMCRSGSIAMSIGKENISNINK